MSVGGATWDTAGTLELGSGNTFTVADATEDGDFALFDAAWWTFTPASSARVVLAPSEDAVLVLYIGDIYAHRDDVPVVDFEGDASVFVLQAGVTYHLLAGHNGFSAPTEYQVTWTQTVYAASPWIDTLRDRTDNQLISSNAPGLILDNARTEFQTAGPWSEAPIGTPARAMPSRVGSWSALQELGGPLVSTATVCVWNHARKGNEGTENGWDDVCSPDPLGDFSERHNDADPSISFVGVDDPGGPISDEVSASIVMRAEPYWFAEIRPFLTAFGALNVALDPVADGYPADATPEFEGPLELLKIELTGDSLGGRAAAGEGDAVTGTVLYMLRREQAPLYSGGDPSEGDVWLPWKRGPITWNITKSPLEFTYVDGPPEWTEVDFVISGDTGWEGLADLSVDEDPDEKVVIAMDRSFGPPPDFADVSAPVTTAIRYTFRSPRYRWVYPQTTVVRQSHRDDVRGTSSAPRLWPLPKTSRIAGGYPGGSGM